MALLKQDKEQLSSKENAFNVPSFVLNVLIWVTWGWLFAPLADYLGIIFSREDFRTNQILLVGIVVLLVVQMQKENLRPKLDAMPVLRIRPFLLLLVSSITYLLIERFLDVNTLSASLFGLTTYGLLGLWLPKQQWRSGLPAALLLIGTLPFGDHMQTFIGYPMRIFTAKIVQDGLAAAGVASVGVDTILVFENGVSHIDIPCSGVKSLWTGSLFLLAATWIENRKLNGWWVVTAVTFFLLLFLSNLTRVAILITIGEVFGLPLLAEMLHIPLGVLGFIGACAAAVAMLSKSKGQGARSKEAITVNSQQSTVNEQPKQARHSQFTIHYSQFIILFLLTTMALLYSPRPVTDLTTETQPWTFTDELTITPLPLKPDENEWLTRDGADAADRFRFEWRGVSGSMILISSRTWRAHHRPERCFEVYGLSLDNSSTHLVNQSMPVRLVALGDGNQQTLFTATYWFQSTTQTTDDYGTRIWSDLAPKRHRWMLVSIIFDEVVDPNSADIAAFYEMMQGAVEEQLAISN